MEKYHWELIFLFVRLIYKTTDFEFRLSTEFSFAYSNSTYTLTKKFIKLVSTNINSSASFFSPSASGLSWQNLKRTAWCILPLSYGKNYLKIYIMVYKKDRPFLTDQPNALYVIFLFYAAPTMLILFLGCISRRISACFFAAIWI